MYKCTECECLYEVKPEYCDCGNDEFVIIVQEENIPQEQVKEENKPVSDVQEKNENIQKEVEEVAPKVRHSLITSLDWVSLSIFFICILLSIVILCIKPNENISAENNENKKEEIVKNIPDIDKFWNNSVKENSVNLKPAKQETVPVQNVVKSVKQPVKQEIKKTTPKVTTVPLKKSTKKIVNKTPAKSTVQKEPKTVQTKITVQTNQTKSNQTVNNQVKTTQKVTTSQENQIKIQPVENKVVISEAEKKELINYKAKLRNTIGQKIDFTQVIGDGNCVVSFKLNSSGKLINRSFTKQSTNITLNDAVYKAVMSTPTYNPPPAAYNNETLNLNIKFYNKNFEITLN